MSFKLYSIESRKGGVGKTTIAMNLAKQLLSKGPVLMLDCDITGTSISGPATNSIYWKDDANVLKDENGMPLNLLGYFLNKYIKGNSNMTDFAKDGMLQEKKINVIGSQLYAPSSRAIVDTRLLMDEIHSYWLMEFVDALIKAFEMHYDGKLVHIIIDNSPGYVGFCQSLHNYMLKLGPEQAKTLMVSSIDEQDLKSCIYACGEIKNLVENRISVATFYQSQLDGKTVNADTEKRINENSDLKKFYFSLIDNQDLLKSYSKDNIVTKSYLSLILNKVPKSLKDDNFDYTFENVLTPEELELFNQVTSAKDSEPQTIIYYDEAISCQYYIKYLKSRIEDESRDKYWSNRYKDLESFNAEYSQLPDRIGTISKMETIYNNLISNLSKRGYSRIAKVIPQLWSPSYAIGELQDLISKISSRTFAARRVELTGEDKNNIHNFNIRNLHSATTRNHLIAESLELEALYKYVDEVAKSENETDKRQYGVISLFLHVTLKFIIEDCRNAENIKDALLKDLRDHPFGYSWRDYVDEKITRNLQVDATDLPIEMFFQHFFDEFHSQFCLTVVRLIDIHRDFDVLLKALKLYVPTSSPLMFSRELLDYLTNVIAYKAEAFDEEKLAKIKKNAFVMKRVQEVVRDSVLKNWK